RAAERAGPGATLELAAGEHLGGVVLPRDARLLGAPGARIAAEDAVLRGEGALTVEGIELLGGRAEGGGVHAAGDLALVDVRWEGSSEAPFVTGGSLFVRGGAYAGDGVVFQTGAVTGRPRRAELVDVAIEGLVATPADHVDVRGLSGAADLRVSGQSLL